MKTKLMIGAALLAVLSNVAAAADDSIDLRGPVGYKAFFQIEGYDLNPSTKIMQLLVAPQKNCETMLVLFGAEKDGIVERLGGHIKLKNTEAGRKYRETMITELKPGGVLIIESIQCRNGVRDVQTLDSKKGPSSSRPSSPSLRDLPFFK